MPFAELSLEEFNANPVTPAANNVSALLLRGVYTPHEMQGFNQEMTAPYDLRSPRWHHPVTTTEALARIGKFPNTLHVVSTLAVIATQLDKNAQNVAPMYSFDQVAIRPHKDDVQDESLTLIVVTGSVSYHVGGKRKMTPTGLTHVDAETKSAGSGDVLVLNNKARSKRGRPLHSSTNGVGPRYPYDFLTYILADHSRGI